MTIGLINLYATRNLGDSAIYAALAGMTPGGEAVGVLDEANPLAVPGLIQLPNLPRCDGYVSVGGDIFNNARPKLVTRKFLSNVAAISRHAGRTMLFGQSIPRSCRGPAFHLLAAALRRLPAVVVRDEESHRRLIAAGVAAELSHDSAFTLSFGERARQAARDLYAAAGLDPERTVVISLRGESSMYGSTGRSAEQGLGDLAAALMRRGHQVAFVLQADCGVADSDLEMCDRIRVELPGIAVLDPFVPAMGIAAYALLGGILEAARMVVAVRYHTAVLRMVAGRLPFVLHYSNKGEDLCRRHGIAGLGLAEAGSLSSVRLAEASADGAFDVAPVAADVRQHFASALSVTLGRPVQAGAIAADHRLRVGAAA